MVSATAPASPNLTLSQLPGQQTAAEDPAHTRALSGGPLPILRRLHSNVGYTLEYHYAGSRRSLAGRGFLGFATMSLVDSRDGLKTTTDFRQDFPFIGRQTSISIHGGLVLLSAREFEWSTQSTPVPDPAQAVHFVHLQSELDRSYEADREGSLHGQLVREVTRSLDWDFHHGAISQETTETSSPMAPGEVLRTVRSTTYDAAAAAQGCLALPSRIDVSHEATGRETVLRSTSMSHGAVDCRLQSETDLSSNDPARQLHTQYVYDNLGRIASVSQGDVAGTAASRVVQFAYPPNSSRPLSEARLISGETPFAIGHAWNEALGLETGRSEPQGSVTGWHYDDFGRLLIETRPDGVTQTSYTACGPCFAGTARYVIRQTRSDGYWSETQHDQMGRLWDGPRCWPTAPQAASCWSTTRMAVWCASPCPSGRAPQRSTGRRRPMIPRGAPRPWSSLQARSSQPAPP